MTAVSQPSRQRPSAEALEVARALARAHFARDIAAARERIGESANVKEDKLAAIDIRGEITRMRAERIAGEDARGIPRRPLREVARQFSDWDASIDRGTPSR